MADAVFGGAAMQAGSLAAGGLEMIPWCSVCKQTTYLTPFTGDGHGGLMCAWHLEDQKRHAVIEQAVRKFPDVLRAGGNLLGKDASSLRISAGIDWLETWLEFTVYPDLIRAEFRRLMNG